MKVSAIARPDEMELVESAVANLLVGDDAVDGAHCFMFFNTMSNKRLTPERMHIITSSAPQSAILWIKKENEEGA